MLNVIPRVYKHLGESIVVEVLVDQTQFPQFIISMVYPTCCLISLYV